MRPSKPETDASKTLRTICADSPVWDNHTCTTVQPGRGDSIAELQRHKRSGVDVVGLNVGFDAAPPEDTIKVLADFRRWIKAHSDEYALIARAGDIDDARRQGRLGIFFNIEGGNALSGQLSMVSLYYELGVRWMLFAYNRNNALAGGCQDGDAGLTPFGRQVLTEMERVGMMVCCSHISERSAMEIMSLAKNPVIYSHSNPKAVWSHARNISDAAIRACAATGGVVGINGIGVFLGNNDIRIDTVVKHIEYTVNLIGSEHVAIGLDYAYDQDECQAFVKAHPEAYPIDEYPDGIEMVMPECLPQIAERLLERGFSEHDVRNIMGGNLMRLARQIWK